MSVVRGLQTGVSGLRVEGDAIGVVGDNIANVNTPGFKRQRAAFEDVFSLGSGGAQSGGGVKLHSIQQQFTQGALVNTGVSTDVALNGDGFFLVGGNVNGVTGTFYTRAGQFALDPAGRLVNPQGLQVMGRLINPLGQLGASVVPLTVSTGSLAPQQTTEMQITANLDASAEVPLDAFDPNNPSTTSNLSTSMPLHDSLGAAHSLDIYFTKVGANEWQYHAVVSGDELDPIQPGTNVEVGSGTLSFDTDGALAQFAENPINVNFAGATPGQVVELSFGNPIANGGSGLDGTTQFSMPGGVSSQSQNGFASGDLSGINITADGTVLGLYSNGRSVPVGQLQVAKFRATEGLARAGQNLWAETSESGTAAVAAPGSGGRGTVTSGAVESANVDLGEEMVSMIQHQRAFSANSKVIATADEMLSELMQIKR